VSTSIARRALTGRRPPTARAHARIPREHRRGTKRQIRERDIAASRYAAR
jgi:hypothetical protein